MTKTVTRFSSAARLIWPKALYRARDERGIGRPRDTYTVCVNGCKKKEEGWKGATDTGRGEESRLREAALFLVSAIYTSIRNNDGCHRTEQERELLDANASGSLMEPIFNSARRRFSSPSYTHTYAHDEHTLSSFPSRFLSSFCPSPPPALFRFCSFRAVTPNPIQIFFGKTLTTVCVTIDDSSNEIIYCCVGVDCTQSAHDNTSTMTFNNFFIRDKPKFSSRTYCTASFDVYIHS